MHFSLRIWLWFGSWRNTYINGKRELKNLEGKIKIYPSFPPMAYRPIATLSVIIFFFLFTSFSPSCNSSSASITLPSDSQKVSLGLYYESLCPYSANFIVNYLVKLFETDLISIVDLNLVPWGNAKIRDNNTFDCQVTFFFCGISSDSTD